MGYLRFHFRRDYEYRLVDNLPEAVLAKYPDDVEVYMTAAKPCLERARLTLTDEKMEAALITKRRKIEVSGYTSWLSNTWS